MFSPPFSNFLINIFWAILDVELFHMKCWIILLFFCFILLLLLLLISLIALSLVLTTLETYVSGKIARLVRIVILPFRDNFLCFQMLSIVFKFVFFGWKSNLKLFSSIFVMTMARVSIWNLIQDSPCGK